MGGSGNRTLKKKKHSNKNNNKLTAVTVIIYKGGQGGCIYVYFTTLDSLECRGSSIKFKMYIIKCRLEFTENVFV